MKDLLIPKIAEKPSPCKICRTMQDCLDVENGRRERNHEERIENLDHIKHCGQWKPIW